jgi:radical SAM superfamily enzyme YgiQ (UPF0313 family)
MEKIFLNKRKIKVELIHPPHPNSTEDRLDPPLGLLSIASYLRQKIPNIEIFINDLSGIKENDWHIKPADIYGVTVYIPSMNVAKTICRKCKEVNPDSIVVVGGAHPTAVPNSMKIPEVDYIVLGEGELAMEQLCLSVINGEKIKEQEIRGIPIDEIVFPAFDLIDPKTYKRNIGGVASLPILTSRGCPFSCAFCGLNRMHKLKPSIRFSSPSQVANDIKRIKEEFGINAINFQDDIFTMKHERLFEILKLIEPMNIVFRCHGRAGLDNEEVYKRLAQAGCSQVSWGIESGSQEILNRMNKNVKVQDNLNVIRWAKKYGISARAFFVIGFPGETQKTIQETKDFIIESQPDQFFISNFIPYPGTDVWYDPEYYGVTDISCNFDEYYFTSKDGTGGITISTKWLSKEEFRILELDFRKWMSKNIQRKGYLQSYEKQLEENKL